MAYDKQEWVDYPLEDTPISSERLLHIEDGIYEASNNADLGVSKANSALQTSRPYIDTTNPYTITDNVMTSWNLQMQQFRVGGSSSELSSGIEMPSMDSLKQLKSFISAKIDYMSSKNKINLLRKTSGSCVVSYIDSEESVIDYTVASEQIPMQYYYINDSSSGYYMPSGISSTDEPTAITVYKNGYVYTYTLGHDTSKAYVRSASDGTVVNSWVTTNTGSSNTYVVALVNYGSSYEFLVVGINYSNHTIIQNGLIGDRYSSYTYVFYPMVLTYGNLPSVVIDDSVISTATTYSSAKIESMLGDEFSALYTAVTSFSPGAISFLYKDGDTTNSYAHSSSSTTPPYWEWLENGQYTVSATYAPKSITLNNGSVLELEIPTDDIYYNNNSSFIWYRIADISVIDSTYAGYYLLLICETYNSNYWVYASILNTNTHERDTVPYLWDGLSQPAYPFTLTWEKKSDVIDDSTVSATKTYSSEKIESLIGGIIDDTQPYSTTSTISANKIQEYIDTLTEQIDYLTYKTITFESSTGTLSTTDNVFFNLQDTAYYSYGYGRSDTQLSDKYCIVFDIPSGTDLSIMPDIVQTDVNTIITAQLVNPSEDEDIFAYHDNNGTDLAFDWRGLYLYREYDGGTYAYLLIAKKSDKLYMTAVSVTELSGGSKGTYNNLEALCLNWYNNPITSGIKLKYKRFTD